MKKMSILTAIAAAASLVSSSAMADDTMEHCQVVKDGQGMIAAGKADCSTTSHSCAGQNTANDPSSWISVPKGECAKINAGELTGLSPETTNKLSVADPSAPPTVPASSTTVTN